MDCSHSQGKQNDLLVRIREFVARSSGLRENGSQPDRARISQSADGKALEIAASELDDVLSRSDNEGQDFIQVNFRSGSKILITDTLIGFKPVPLSGLDMTKIPKVVTTPDIVSVFEAIQEALHGGESQDQEVALLRKVFDAVVSGGEAVGFDLARERAWLGRIPSQTFKVTA